ncbi:hypothetical protein ABK040_011781 [Willaertia magna]
MKYAEYLRQNEETFKHSKERLFSHPRTSNTYSTHTTKRIFARPRIQHDKRNELTKAISDFDVTYLKDIVFEFNDVDMKLKINHNEGVDNELLQSTVMEDSDEDFVTYEKPFPPTEPQLTLEGEDCDEVMEIIPCNELGQPIPTLELLLTDPLKEYLKKANTNQ